MTPLTTAGHPPIILASPPVRGPLFEILKPHIPDLAVLGYNEIVQGIQIESLGYARWPDEAAAPATPAPVEPASIGAA